MALLPDPTTAASERSSVKNRLTGSRRRGSGIKSRHRSRTVSKMSLRGARRMRAQGVQGQGCPQHESTQPGPLTLLPQKTRVRQQAQVQTVSKTSLRGLPASKRKQRRLSHGFVTGSYPKALEGSLRDVPGPL